MIILDMSPERAIDQDGRGTPRAAGLGQSQRSILDVLKRRGSSTVPRIAEALGLNVETVRDHLKALTKHGLVHREGRLRAGPGRPEIVYGLTVAAETLFPRREGEVLQELALYLRDTGNAAVLHAFFDRFVGSRREEAMARVEGLEGRARVDEAAAILSELGFMAEVEEVEGGARLRLCHCPLRELVDVSKVPCRAEIGFVNELLGERPARQSYIPAGDASCSYATQSP